MLAAAGNEEIRRALTDRRGGSQWVVPTDAELDADDVAAFEQLGVHHGTRDGSGFISPVADYAAGRHGDALVRPTAAVLREMLRECRAGGEILLARRARPGRRARRDASHTRRYGRAARLRGRATRSRDSTSRGSAPASSCSLDVSSELCLRAAEVHDLPAAVLFTDPPMRSLASMTTISIIPGGHRAFETWIRDTLHRPGPG